ncbi:MAG: hypothetical protein A2934_05360 [Candidatus Sungbacteria bacterium RIFCSPLOWO2_01_FULL_47_10]|uniref:Transmembrane protein n=1 Tax=Candidatus Sungbacteria bacterium RIFCSPLOWO2_01_FULL_47_10 TaxID=1802276 RepID=A0A1G2L1B3_9BACT|nr:MAG: hypothetical protein A2934_05360 [Candidatus Sungbacteria bacterium RIFCSPLOWO2_01_FULL_47_10]
MYPTPVPPEEGTMFGGGSSVSGSLAGDLQHISPNNKEMLIGRLEALKSMTLEEEGVRDSVQKGLEREREIADMKRSFSYDFLELVYRLFHVGARHIAEMDKKEVEDLDAIVYEQISAKKRLSRRIMWFSCVTVIGFFLFCLFTDTSSEFLRSDYIKKRGKLKELFGDNYFPHDVLHERIEEALAVKP